MAYNCLGSRIDLCIDINVLKYIIEEDLFFFCPRGVTLHAICSHSLHLYKCLGHRDILEL